MRTWDKDPQAVLDWDFTWTDWLTGGEVITGTPLITIDAGLTKDSQSNTNSVVKVWLSGGTVGTTYKVSCRITTNSSPARTDERSLLIRITER